MIGFPKRKALFQRNLLDELHRKVYMASQQLQQSSGAKQGFFYGYIVVAATFFMMVAVFGAVNAFGVFFKPVLTEFGWTRAVTSGAFSLSWIMQGVFAIVMGTLTDRLGPRMVMTLCGLLLGLGYLLMSQIGGIWQLYLFYGGIIGIGMGAAWVPIMSTVTRWFSERRSMMTGIVMAGGGIGILIAPPMTNQLISTYDWRVAYVILGGIVLVVVVSAAQLLRRVPTQVQQRPYGDSEGEETAGLKSVAEAFSLQQAVYTRQFWVVFAMLFCLGFSIFAIIVHIAPHATELGISTTAAANMLATIGGLSIAGRVVLGSAADRIGNRQVFIIGFILISAALFWLVQAKEAWMLYLAAAILGFGWGIGAVAAPLVAGLFGLSSHGVILGVITFGYTIGAAAGPFVAGFIFDVTSSYQLAFLVSAAIGVVGLIVTALLTPTKEN